jgi:hypothetical protein
MGLQSDSELVAIQFSIAFLTRSPHFCFRPINSRHASLISAPACFNEVKSWTLNLCYQLSYSNFEHFHDRLQNSFTYWFVWTLGWYRALCPRSTLNFGCAIDDWFSYQFRDMVTDHIFILYWSFIKHRSFLGTLGCSPFLFLRKVCYHRHDLCLLQRSSLLLIKAASLAQLLGISFFDEYRLDSYHFEFYSFF